MKYVFITLLTLILFGSCSSYYYSVIDTNDEYVQKNENNEFLIEGDSLDVIYSFYGENAPIRITIINKMSIPVYIDWRESGVVIDNQLSSFKAQYLMGDFDRNKEPIDYRRFLNDPTGMEMIHPYKQLSRQMLELNNFGFDKIKKNEFSDMRFEADTTQCYKGIEYNEEDSPIFFKIFLVMHLDETREYKPLFFETDFYQSRLIKGGKTSPQKMMKYVGEQNGNIFFVKNQKGQTLGNVGVKSLEVVGIAITIAADILAGDGYNEYY